MNTWHHRFLMLFWLAVLAGCQSRSVPETTKIDKAYLRENALGNAAQLVDVRSAEEYKAGHIDGAVNFNIAQSEIFMEQINTLEKDRPVYLYCKAGGRSDRAATLLRDNGFTKIFDYSGGYDDWILER